MFTNIYIKCTVFQPYIRKFEKFIEFACDKTEEGHIVVVCEL
jgi:hypothetical protein